MVSTIVSFVTNNKAGLLSLEVLRGFYYLTVTSVFIKTIVPTTAFLRGNHHVRPLPRRSRSRRSPRPPYLTKPLLDGFKWQWFFAPISTSREAIWILDCQTQDIHSQFYTGLNSANLRASLANSQSSHRYFVCKISFDFLRRSLLAWKASSASRFETFHALKRLHNRQDSFNA